LTRILQDPKFSALSCKFQRTIFSTTTTVRAHKNPLKN